MFVEERHQEILRLLNENEKVKVKELSKRFEVTEDCIRKDLASMEAKNLLKRTYGGAVLPDTLHPGHTNIVSIRKDKNIDFVIVNGENSAEGMGMTEKNFKDILAQNINVITMGNHTWGKKDIFKFIEKDKRCRKSAVL